jgi:hypothetical protein
VEYLVVGGYAVGFYGYPRATGDMDIWIAISPSNAEKTVRALKEFGFGVVGLSKDLFSQKNQVIRMGRPPLRIEILTSVSGVDFKECYEGKVTKAIDDVNVNFISLGHLKTNKKAAGRLKDLNDLENLP